MQRTLLALFFFTFLALPVPFSRLVAYCPRFPGFREREAIEEVAVCTVFLFHIATSDRRESPAQEKLTDQGIQVRLQQLRARLAALNSSRAGRSNNVVEGIEEDGEETRRDRGTRTHQQRTAGSSIPRSKAWP